MDAVIVGSGPAGWAAAAASRALGINVHLVAPDPEAAFTPTYCVWLDEVPLWRDVMAEIWPAVTVDFDRGAHRVERAYARFDNERLARRLRDDAKGTQLWPAAVESVQAEGDSLLVHLSDGRVRKTDYVVDCSGAGSSLVRREEGPPPAVQTAMGRVIRPASSGGAMDVPVLMDYRPVERSGPASFGYVLPFADGTMLVEETVLAARPAVAPEDLRPRLERRLEQYGLQDAEVVDTERVAIPMGAPLPMAEQPVVPFGAAASMVHPATGYSVGFVLRRAPLLAAALRRAAGDPDPVARATRVNRSVWTKALRRTRAMHALGLEVLLGLAPEQVGAFFASFFETPRWAWTAYLRTDAPVGRIAAAMTAAFARMDPESRRTVQEAIRARGVFEVGRSVWAA